MWDAAMHVLVAVPCGQSLQEIQFETKLSESRKRRTR